MGLLKASTRVNRKSSSRADRHKELPLVVHKLPPSVLCPVDDHRSGDQVPRGVHYPARDELHGIATGNRGMGLRSSLPHQHEKKCRAKTPLPQL